MNIHKVRNPFYSRVGQFEEGVQTLVIGLDLKALSSTDKFRCYIGNNKKIWYEIESSEALRLADEYKSIWTNPKGKKVAILPLNKFIKGGENNEGNS